MKTGLVFLNFGEPEDPSLEAVIPFLERIFSLNASLMGPATPEQVRVRSRELAEARAPGLIEEYRLIGGSPLHRQARAQAEGVEAELRRRGHDVVALLGMQFTDPSIEEAVASARSAGVERIIGIPVYPLAGPSTTVAALVKLRAEITSQDWNVAFASIAGWHRHPAYLRLRADAIREVLKRDGLSFQDPGTRLIFSAHGTPLKYLEEGSRYDLYVRHFCGSVANELGASEFLLGYQNHGNRPGVRWTQPGIDTVVAEVDARQVVVDAVSFMHEQSETLAELDHELRGLAEERGLEFHRVPIPFAAPEFIGLLSDLIEGIPHPTQESDVALAVAGIPFQQCLCTPVRGTYCLNPSLRGDGNLNPP